MMDFKEAQKAANHAHRCFWAGMILGLVTGAVPAPYPWYVALGSIPVAGLVAWYTSAPIRWREKR